MVQKGCDIFSVAQMDYVTAGRDGGVASGGFAASASGHPMEIKRRGWTAVWIGRSCNSSYRAAVCRILATLRGIVKRLLRACHACNRSNGWNSTQIGGYEVHARGMADADGAVTLAMMLGPSAIVARMNAGESVRFE